MALTRELGVFGATMMGLGSIVGTGVFVSIGVAAGVAGPAVIAAIVVAAGVATCNALSSAQLAAEHPVSGGTYEYGYKHLHPALGFTAGWMFLCAKSASAATAAMGFAGYALHIAGGDPRWLPGVAVGAVVVLTALVLGGMKRSNVASMVIVSVTLAALGCFVVAGVPALTERGGAYLSPFWGVGGMAGFLEATALMFVAYTGYGRIATLGEEVKDPRKVIPRAIVVTLIVSALLYTAVGVVAVGTVGAEALSEATGETAAPLEVASRSFDVAMLPGLSGVPGVVAVGAMTAMLGVLLNLILGLSRVLLAMGRRGDMPAATADVRVSVLVTGAVIAALAAVGSVKLAWSFSAFTVLVYYAITNACALRLPREHRLYPRAFAWGGLAACAFLAFFVEWPVWVTGLGVIGVGLAWRALSRKRLRPAR